MPLLEMTVIGFMSLIALIAAGVIALLAAYRH
jgi:hypothetical protein